MKKEIENEKKIMTKEYVSLQPEIEKLKKLWRGGKIKEWLSTKDGRDLEKKEKKQRYLDNQIRKNQAEKMKMKKLETFIKNQLKGQIYISDIDSIYRLYMKGIQHNGSIIDNPEQRIINSCITALDKSINSVIYDLEHVFGVESYM